MERTKQNLTRRNKMTSYEILLGYAVNSSNPIDSLGMDIYDLDQEFVCSSLTEKEQKANRRRVKQLKKVLSDMELLVLSEQYI